MPDGSVSVVLSDDVRCVDWQTRNVQFISRVAPAVLQDVVAKLEALIINPYA